MTVFDWHKAAKELRDRGAKFADAGLAEDWFHTAGPILKDGEPFIAEFGPYLSSYWATPVLSIENEDGSELRIVCATESDKWNADTIWPESALSIFQGTAAERQ